MAHVKVNPNRMELLRLKKRTQLAKRGHRLLKEKRDGLMREFLRIMTKARSLRQQVDQTLSTALAHFVLAQASMVPQATQLVAQLRIQKTEVGVAQKNIMGVHIPEFSIKTTKTAEDYSVWETSPQLDAGLHTLRQVLPVLLELASIEKAAFLLAQEIEKTRRRVNALEHVLIPELVSTSRYIRMKLEEQERAAIVTVMAIKNLMEESQ